MMAHVPPEILLWLKVTPNAKNNELMGWENNYLKVRLAAPPIEGKANKALCEFLAKIFAVPKRHVELLHGETSRLKRVKIIAPQHIPELVLQKPVADEQ